MKNFDKINYMRARKQAIKVHKIEPETLAYLDANFKDNWQPAGLNQIKVTYALKYADGRIARHETALVKIKDLNDEVKKLNEVKNATQEISK